MSKTVSFVARDELAEWLESQADAEMKTVSSFVQDRVAAEYRRQSGVEGDKGGSTPEAEKLESDTEFERGGKDAADAVRAEFSENLSGDDDKRMTHVILREGTPAEVVAEVKRRQGQN